MKRVELCRVKSWLTGDEQVFWRATSEEMTRESARHLSKRPKIKLTIPARLAIWLILAMLLLGFWKCCALFGQVVPTSPVRGDIVVLPGSGGVWEKFQELGCLSPYKVLRKR